MGLARLLGPTALPFSPPAIEESSARSILVLKHDDRGVVTCGWTV